MRAARVEDEIGQALFVIDDIDQRRQIDALAVEEGAARKLAGQGGTRRGVAVEHGVEIEAAFGKLAPGQSALRRIGAQCERDQLVVTARAALDRHPARCLIGKKLEIGQHDAEIEIGLVGRKGTVGGDFAQLVADAEIAR